ncbi:Hypothetical predicted protein [Olea europaea subsp. europaea]|uniref:Uncharacterized protein n=1 Tax=Olea europaea subsp. europaea TaxID=158383 RepID=A0A8S0PIR4_OLEEU|nr:Hypothetical predicted protein [Olea europaea subsp. europaea]
MPSQVSKRLSNPLEVLRSHSSLQDAFYCRMRRPFNAGNNISCLHGESAVGLSWDTS